MPGLRALNIGRLLPNRSTDFCLWEINEMRGLRLLIIGVAMICATDLAQAKLPWGDSYWAYTYKSFNIVADGSSGFAENLGRDMARFDYAFFAVTKLQLGDWRPVTNIYALDQSTINLAWPSPYPIQSDYRIGEFANDIIVDNNGEGDNRNRGAYYGYAGILLSGLGSAFQRGTCRGSISYSPRA